MFCPNCGSQNPDINKFCVSCGSSLVKSQEQSSNESSRIQLLCKACGGVLNAPNDRNVLMRPYCGAKELIAESDKVSVQRIKSNTVKDLAFGVMDRIEEAKRQKKEEERIREEKRQEEAKKLFPIC